MLWPLSYLTKTWRAVQDLNLGEEICNLLPDHSANRPWLCGGCRRLAPTLASDDRPIISGIAETALVPGAGLEPATSRTEGDPRTVLCGTLHGRGHPLP